MSASSLCQTPVLHTIANLGLGGAEDGVMGDPARPGGAERKVPIAARACLVLPV